MTKFDLRTAAALLGATLVAGATTAVAQPTPTTLACASAKQKDLGKYAAAVLGCWSKAAKLGVAVDPLCVSKAEDKWMAAHQKSEDKAVLSGAACATDAQTRYVGGGFCLAGVCEKGVIGKTCATHADCSDWDGDLDAADDVDEATALASLVVSISNPADGLADGVGPALYPAPVANACASAKLKEAGKLAAALMGCWSKASKTGAPVDQVKCLDGAAAKFTAAFAKAETKPPCTTTGDAAAILTTVQSFVELGVKYTPKANGCGSGFVTGAESCDDGNNVDTDNCPADCTIDFCAPVTGSDRAFTVNYTAPKNVAAIRVNVDYPEGAVSIPGSGAIAYGPGTDLTDVLGDPITIAAFNDRDFALTASLADSAAAGYGTTGSLFTVHFEDCTGATPPSAAAFSCSVIDAADPLGKAIAGSSCSVN